MNRNVLALALLGALAASGAAQAALIGNGAYAATYVRDCRTAAARAANAAVPDMCVESTSSFTGSMVEERADLQAGGLSAAVSPTALALGTSAGGLATQSSVGLGASPGVLELHQGAFTGASYARVSGHSAGLQGFYYSGAGSSNRTIHTSLDYSAASLVDHAGFTAAVTDPAALISAKVRVFSLASASFDFNWTDPAPHFMAQALAFSEQAAVRADYQLVDTQEEYVSGPGPYHRNLHFSMTPGRYYFVESYLGLWAKFGGQVDALHTMTVALGTMEAAAPGADAVFVRNMEGLTPVPHGVLPEPCGLVLVATALAVAGARRRRA